MAARDWPAPSSPNLVGSSTFKKGAPHKHESGRRFQQRSGGRDKAKLLKNGTATVFNAIDEMLISGGYVPGPHSTKDSQWWCQCVPLPANRVGVPPPSDVMIALRAQACALVRNPVHPRAAHEQA